MRTICSRVCPQRPCTFRSNTGLRIVPALPWRMRELARNLPLGGDEQEWGRGMFDRVKGWAASILAASAGLLLLGFGIGTSPAMPGYAVVFVDDGSKSFIAPQCEKIWRGKATETFDLMRRTTASEAEKLHYKPDYDCIQTGAFAQDGPSLSGLLLEKIGILPRKKYWWDTPFQTENGVVYPGVTPVAAVGAAVESDGTPTFCYEGNPQQANGDKPELTIDQQDICGEIAIRHLQASGTMPTETADQIVNRTLADENACSAPIPTTATGRSRPPTPDEVVACVTEREIARFRSEKAGGNAP